MTTILINDEKFMFISAVNHHIGVLFAVAVGDGYKEHDIYPCASCGTSVHGERFSATHYRMADPNDSEEVWICDDCRLWHANGELPVDGWRP